MPPRIIEINELAVWRVMIQNWVGGTPLDGERELHFPVVRSRDEIVKWIGKMKLIWMWAASSHGRQCVLHTLRMPHQWAKKQTITIHDYS